MQKKALIIASMASMIDNFNRNNISILEDLGYEVTLAANFESEDSNSIEKVNVFKEEMLSSGHRVIQIDFSRKIANFSKQLRSIKQVQELSKEHFDLVHCHSPICAAITRFCFRKSGARVIYTAHGFHFYKGAPLKNWLIYYPVEWLCAHWTDTLITINKEDFNRAKKKLKAKKVEYIPGVGIDINKFANTVIDKTAKRREIGIPEDAFMLLSVGELNGNKNHKIVIEALGKIQDSNIHYVIAGVGDQKDKLESLARENKVNLHLLGYRKDVAELYKCADLYVHPSLREGLPVALMEAIASKLNCVCSNIRGCSDLVENGMFIPTDADSVKAQILQFFEEDNLVVNYINLGKYDSSFVNKKMEGIYSQID